MFPDDRDDDDSVYFEVERRFESTTPRGVEITRQAFWGTVRVPRGDVPALVAAIRRVTFDELDRETIGELRVSAMDAKTDDSGFRRLTGWLGRVAGRLAAFDGAVEAIRLILRAFGVPI